MCVVTGLLAESGPQGVSDHFPAGVARMTLAAV